MEDARELVPQAVRAEPTRRVRLGVLSGSRLLVFALLFLIIVVGAYFRFTGLDWDQDQHLHPDERFLTMVLSSLQRPASIGAYFNTSVSGWNPYNKGWDFFVYGTLPIFIIRFVGEELGKTTYGQIYLVGRALSGIFDLLTVLLLFLIARRLYDTRVALLASALSAAAVLQIQQSHFMTVDSFATTFAMLAFLSAVLVAQEGKLWQYLLMGSAIGMAVASRINLVLLGPLAVVAAGLYLRHTLSGSEDPQIRSKVIERTVLRLVLAGVVSLVAFRIAQPYAFQGPGFLSLHLNDGWVQNMRSIQAQATGEVDMPPSHQWTNRPAYLFPLSHMVLWGLGLPLGAAAWVGLALAGWQLLRKRRWQHALPVAWVLILFGYQGQQFTKTMRYFLQIYPTLAMLAAFLLVWLWDSRLRIAYFVLRNRRSGHAVRNTQYAVRTGIIPGTFLLLVLAGTYTWAFAFTRIYTRPVSRVAASRWIYDHVPSAATIHFETADGAESGVQVPLYLSNSVYAANGFVVQPDGIPYRTSFVPVADGNLGTVTFNQIQVLEGNPDPETIEVSLATDPTGQNVVASRQVQIRAEGNAGPFIVDFAGVPVQVDRRYYVFTRALDGGAIKIVGRETGTVAYQTDHGPETAMLRLSYVLETDRTGVVYGHFLFGAGAEFQRDLEQGDLSAGVRQVFEDQGIPLSNDITVAAVVPGSQWRIDDRGHGRTYTVAREDGGLNVYAGQLAGQNASSFKLSQPGTVRSITLNYLIDPMGDSEPETFQAMIAGDPGGQQVLAQGQVTAHMEEANDPRGRTYTIELPTTPLEADRDYFLITRALDGAPVQAWSTIIANEHWDDPVPLRLDGKDGFGMYMGFQMQNYNNDSPEKFEDLLEWLGQADYIMITSNRLYGSIPRLPMRYPITTEYYRLLFAGQLGFKLEKTFTAYPNIGPIQIPDQSAEEAFTVYDHPKVWVFRKTEDFSRAKVRTLLADKAKGPFIFVKPVDVKKASSASTLTTLELPHDRWVRQQEAGTWSAIFNPDSIINRSVPLTILLWLIAVELIGLAVFPIAFVVFSRLADRGYVLSKALGLLLLAWLIWFLSSLTPLPYARWSIGLCLLVLAGLSAVIVYRQRESITDFVAENRRLLLIGETLFLFAFFAFLLVRMGNPDLWHPARGGEKPMDFSYLNAVIKSRSFPPYDPWFAGGYINYYYFGFVIVGTLIKLLGIVPAKAYNLAVPTLFALTFVGAFAVVYNLARGNSGELGGAEEERIRITQYAVRNATDTRAVLFGILGGLFVAVIGNLEEAQVLLGGLKNISASGLRSTIPGLATLVGALQGLLKMIDGRSLGIPNDWWFWNASRVMPNGEINEFPFFTFVYADLHAHMIALPITLLALAMAVHVIRSTVRPRTLSELGISLDGPPGWLRQIDWSELAQLAAWALIIGSLRATNTWDYPTYLLVAAGALGVREVWRRGRIDLVAVWEAGWRFGLVVLLSMLFFWPYIQNYATAYTSAQLWHGERATLGDYLTIHGFFLFIVGTFLVIETLDWWRQQGRQLWSAGSEVSLLVQYGAVVLILAVAGLAYLRMWVPALGLVLAAPATVLVLRNDVSPRRRLVGLLFLLGMILTLAVEFIVLKGDIGRMNTVFKFYIQVWVLWGVAAATSLAWLVPRIRRWTPTLRQAWWGAFAVMFVAALLYPVLATRAKIQDRFDTSLGPGLDGTAFMRTAVFHDEGQAMQLEYDRLAIRWMEENIPGTPVVLEGQTVEYRWGSRVAIYTGLPTVVGWRWHQVQQRSVLPGSVVDKRVEDVKTMFNTPDPQRALEMMAKYDVSYVYVGPLERAYYDPNGLAKFDQMTRAGTLEVVYENPAVKIYRVKQASEKQLSSLGSAGRYDDNGKWRMENRGWKTENGKWILTSSFQRPTSILHSPFFTRLTAPATRQDVQPSLLLDRPVDELPIVDDRGWNGLANASPFASTPRQPFDGAQDRAQDVAWVRTGFAVAVWWLVLLLIGLVAWPLVVVALPGFVDRGSALARTAGLIVVGYLVWISASFRWLQNTPATAYLMLLLVGLLSFFVFWRRRTEIVAFCRRRWRLILVEEALFTLAFLLFVGIRVLNPDLWQPWFGGEKPMEFAFLNAILKSAYFPPYDPYFAGGTINYYYYGLYLVGLLIKLTGIVPEVAFNLAVPTLFALTFVGAFSVVYNLTKGNSGELGGTEGELTRNTRYAVRNTADARAVVLGILGGLFVAVIGNLDGVLQVFGELQKTGSIGHFDFWRSSRVIPFTINEFPYFSFLFADLHPHMINITFSILVLALLLHLMRRGDGKWRMENGKWRMENGEWGMENGEWKIENGEWSSTERAPFSPFHFPFSGAFTLENLFFSVLLVLALGAVFVINLWELPAYLGLTLAALLLRSRLATGRWRIGRHGLAFVSVAGLAYLAYRPFYAHYKALHVGLGAVEEGSRLQPFLTVWGFFLFVLASYLVIALVTSEGARWLTVAWRWRRRFNRLWRLSGRLGVGPAWLWWLGLVALLTGLVVGVGLVWIGELVLALMVPLIVAAGVLLLRRQVSAGQQFIALLAFVGLGVVAGTEVVFLKDFLAGGEWYRMNTVFKFTTEAWVLIALASAMALPTIWHGLRAISTVHLVWIGAFGALLLSTLVYPIYGTPARVDDRFPGNRPAIGMLNGMAFMRVGEYQWPDENVVELKYTYAALQWLLDNVKGTPVVAEANIGYYREGGLQVATYTGLPALIGFHQGEQRYDFQVGPRSSRADALFRTTDVSQALDIIHELDISYIYVGQLERAWYPAPGIRKFEDMRNLGLLEVAYENPKVTIYRVTAEGPALG